MADRNNTYPCNAYLDDFIQTCEDSDLNTIRTFGYWSIYVAFNMSTKNTSRPPSCGHIPSILGAISSVRSNTDLRGGCGTTMIAGSVKRVYGDKDSLSIRRTTGFFTTCLSLVSILLVAELAYGKKEDTEPLARLMVLCLLVESESAPTSESKARLFHGFRKYRKFYGRCRCPKCQLRGRTDSIRMV